jgi:hypothetical protein
MEPRAPAPSEGAGIAPLPIMVLTAAAAGCRGSARIHHKCRGMMSYRDFKGVMRPGQNKRHRGRNGGGGGGNNPNNPNNRGPRPPHRMQTFDSNGPNVKIRGNAYQVFERYVALAREAATSGDRIAAENLYQHAEHYFRVMNADGQGAGGPPRPMTPADTEMTGSDSEGDGQHDGQQQPSAPQPPPPSDPDPSSTS